MQVKGNLPRVPNVKRELISLRRGVQSAMSALWVLTVLRVEQAVLSVNQVLLQIKLVLTVPNVMLENINQEKGKINVSNANQVSFQKVQLQHVPNVQQDFFNRNWGARTASHVLQECILRRECISVHIVQLVRIKTVRDKVFVFHVQKVL